MYRENSKIEVGSDYQTIQAAVNNAGPNDIVEVQPGTYREQVTIDESIKLSAPDGAILDGSELGEPTRGDAFGRRVGEGTTGITIEPESEAEPTIAGFVITGYEVAIEADETIGGWSVHNSTLRQNGDDGISAMRSAGDWEIRRTILRSNLEEGIDAEGSKGSWKVENCIIEHNGDDGIDADGPETSADWLLHRSTIRSNGDTGLELKKTTGDWTIQKTKICDNQVGVGAQHTTGDWEIEQSLLDGNRFVGVACVRAGGDWSIRESSIRDLSTGVWAPATSGDWLIENVCFADTYFVPNDNLGEGTAIFAPASSGSGEVHDCIFSNIKKYAINATDSAVLIDATQNYWQERANRDQVACVGNVHFEIEESSPPNIVTPGINSGATVIGSPSADLLGRASNRISELSTEELIRVLLERLSRQK